MAKMIQFEGGEPDGRTSPACLECEANLTDALDGTLSPAEQTRFDAHIAGCGSCSQMLSEAQRGAAWLDMLKTPRPEPSAALLEKILAETSGAELPRRQETETVGEWAVPAWPAYGLPVSAQPFAGRSLAGQILVSQPFIAQTGPGKVLPFRARIATSAQSLRYNLLQPRLAMTAAMAFFSVALTLSLTGVRLNQLRASDLTPTGIRRNFYDASASAARYYGNLKVVYVMESRLEEIRRNSDDDPNHPDNGSDQGKAAPATVEPNQPAPDAQPEKKKAPDGGTSMRQNPLPESGKAHYMPLSMETSGNTSDKSTRSSDGTSTIGSKGHLQTGTSTLPPAARLEYDRTGGE